MGYQADLKLFINGSWRTGEGRDSFSVVNPATGEGIADLPLATEADLDEALEQATALPSAFLGVVVARPARRARRLSFRARRAR